MGQYQLIKKIDEGEFGEVWKAYDVIWKRNVAIKYLKTSDDNNRFVMFCREIEELWKEIENQHIVDIYDHNLRSPKPYFVMEFCDGGNLNCMIGKTNANQLIAILKSMIIALNPRHRLGGFQRDLKPANILRVKKNGRFICKLADFGLARTPNNHTAMTHTVGGTFPYIDPEVLKGEKQFSPASDIYSLGMTAFALLTGKAEIPLLFLTPGPTKLIDLLRWMTSDKSEQRPSLQQIEASLNEIEKELNAEGFPGFWASLSYPGLAVGATGVALIIAGIFGGEE